LRWFELPACTANPEGQTSITGTARFVPATFYIASLPFQDTPPERRISPVKRCPAQTTARDVKTVAPRAGSPIPRPETGQIAGSL
jgi:hypothetical protein